MQSERNYANQAGAGLAQVPREPTLSEKCTQLSQRISSLHIALDTTGSSLLRLFGVSEPNQSGQAPPQPSPGNVDSCLAEMLQSLAVVESRLGSINHLLESRV